MAVTENIAFLEAEEKDLTYIKNLYNHYIEKTTANFYQHSLDIDEIREIMFYNDKRFRCFIIMADGKKAGIIYLSPYSPRESFKYTASLTIYLGREFIGRGLGTVANAFIEDYAKKQGFHTLLMFITDNNVISIKNAEKNGYTFCGVIKEAGFKFNKWLGLAMYQKIL